MSSSNLTNQNTFSNSRGRWLPLAAGMFIFAGLAGTLWALSSAWENDSDRDGWSDEEEILAGTNPFDETEPWDSDGDGIADYLEFQNGTDPLDAGDPPSGLWAAGNGSGIGKLSGASGNELAGMRPESVSLSETALGVEAGSASALVSGATALTDADDEATPPASVEVEIWEYTPKNFALDICGTRVTSGPSLSYSGSFPSGEGAFEITYKAWAFLENGARVRVGADDTASLQIGLLSASSPDGEHAFEWGEWVTYSGEARWSEATITHVSVGGPYALGVEGIHFYERKLIDTTVDDADEDCVCTSGCDMETTADVGSVAFTQPFGRTPFASGFRSGKLRIKKVNPDDDITTPAGIAYDHFVTRRVLSRDASTQSARISADGLWENVYENGVPAGQNTWKSSQVSVAANGSVVETLSDRTVICYDASGNLASVTSPEGVTLSASQLGVKVLRDADGALRQIWSLADGLLDFVSGDGGYAVRWYKPADVSAAVSSSGLYTTTGSPVKVFAFSGEKDEETGPMGTYFFRLRETRGTQFEFNYAWQFDYESGIWSFEKGEESASHTLRRVGDNLFEITETRSSPAGDETSVRLVDRTHGNRSVGKIVDGVAEYTATRVVSGNGVGKVATETDRSGATRAYEYDAHGRVIKETLSSGFGGLPETTEYVYAEHIAGTSVDLRPRSIVHKIAGTLFKTETYVYNDDASVGKTESRSVTANGTTLTSETHYYPANTGKVSAGRVKYEIQADGTATYYEYSDTSFEQAMSGGYTLTETEGVWDNGAFAPVPAKSTRVVRVFDKLGNEVRTENYVHTGEAFELVSWENKSYSPTHKVVATERSDGKSSSADYICTGPVWTIDENGVRTDNTFDSAKRLKTSTRHGARAAMS